MNESRNSVASHRGEHVLSRGAVVAIECIGVVAPDLGVEKHDGVRLCEQTVPVTRLGEVDANTVNVRVQRGQNVQISAVLIENDDVRPARVSESCDEILPNESGATSQHDRSSVHYVICTPWSASHFSGSTCTPL